ncbi:MAG: 1,4-dihydroxy-2-naphthoyl-CoA hydrolase [Myxococcota bacterium]
MSVDPSDIARQLASLDPAARAALLDSLSAGLDQHLGLRYRAASATEVTAVLVVGPQHVQPYGLVHGGVYCSLAEAACSVGAALAVLPQGQSAVGAENHTRFLRPTRQGATLTVVARPDSVDKGWHTWRATIDDDQGRRCAESTVVVRALDAGVALAGETVALPAPARGADRG